MATRHLTHPHKEQIMFSKHSNRTSADNDRRRARGARPSAALIVSSIALFASLGGGAYAASTIGSAQIKNNSVQGADIKNATIKSADIAPGTRNALKGQKGPAGQAGPAGQPGVNGEKGDKGDKGDPGATNVSVVRSTRLIAANSIASDYAACPAGAKATGGGVGNPTGNTGDAIIASGPVDADNGLFEKTGTGTVPTAWWGQYENKGAEPATVYIWVICAS